MFQCLFHVCILVVFPHLFYFVIFSVVREHVEITIRAADPDEKVLVVVQATDGIDPDDFFLDQEHPHLGGGYPWSPPFFATE